MLQYGEKVRAVLSQFDVDPVTGFLPLTDPVTQLPPQFDAWNRLIRDLTPLLHVRGFRKAADQLPLLETDSLQGDDLRAAMRMLTFFAHAYIFQEDEPCSSLPAVISVPWTQVAQRLQRPPVLAHASYVLHNWRRLDPAGPVRIDNLAPISMFLGGQDEMWFILATVEIEAVGATLPALLVAAQQAVAGNDVEAVRHLLGKAHAVLESVRVVLERLPERCDPRAFYLRIRPYLSSLKSIHFQGADPSGVTRSYSGGSAAQSTLLQAADAALGVEHSDHTGTFLQNMRDYMPREHAALLGYLAGVKPTIREYCIGNGLEAEYDACVQDLVKFRSFHVQLVCRFVTTQTGKVGPGNAEGTGGTNPLSFTQAVRNETLAALTTKASDEEN